MKLDKKDVKFSALIARYYRCNIQVILVMNFIIVVMFLIVEILGNSTFQYKILGEENEHVVSFRFGAGPFQTYLFQREVVG